MHLAKMVYERPPSHSSKELGMDIIIPLGIGVFGFILGIIALYVYAALKW